MSKQFSSLGISEPILKASTDLKIEIPTEIQTKVIPYILKSENDLVAIAKTGTGKTAAFGLPLLQLINTNVDQIQVVILSPTRELGQQIFKNLENFATHLPNVSIASICGGTLIKPQIERLQNPTHIIVATPGRLIDLIKRSAINIKQTKYLVLDEADEMVAILKDSLDEILSEIPKDQRLIKYLFSATLPGTIKQLVQNYLHKNVVQIEVNMENVGNNAIDHQYIVVSPEEKLEVLMHFLTSNDTKRGIIFCKTKAAVNKLAKNLAINRFSSGAIHGSLTQPIRDRIMEQFRAGHIKILVATDLASRGIDVPEVEYVINYHLPEVHETYVHRSGRTARAGANGLSLTILQQEEIAEIADFEKVLGINFTKFLKPNASNIEDNNAFLWAKKIFKTKPNHELSADLKDKIKTVFHHLTKDELIDKLIANYFIQNK